MNINLLKEYATVNKLDWRILRAILMNESSGKGFTDKGNVISRFEPAVYKRYRKLFPAMPEKELTCQSTSWGIAQIMGFNYNVLGYNSAIDMLEAFKVSEDEQVKAFLKFCTFYKKGRFLKALQSLDYHLISYLYNGKNYSDNKYDIHLKEHMKEIALA